MEAPLNPPVTDAENLPAVVAQQPGEHYQQFLHALDAGFCVVEVLFEGAVAVDYLFREINPAFERFTGLKDALGRRMREIEPGHDQHWFDRYGEVALTGEPLRMELPANALGRWYSVYAHRIGEPAQNRVAILFIDITERKRIERELAESEARFSALADGLPMPVWVLDAGGVVRFVNSAYYAFFGVAAGAIVGWDQLVHPEDLPVLEYEMDAALAEPRAMHALVRARRGDGQWRWVEISATPRYSADGRFIGLAGSSPDVTERRQIEMAREQLLESERTARNTAESMARLKDEFLATLSHELRTPLTTILGWSDLLLQRLPADDPSHKGLSVIASSARAQKRLISDMLDLSSMLLGKVRLEVELLDLAEQVREALRAQEMVAEEKHLRLSLQVPDQPCLIRGDATRLQQVFWNLLSNALKFTPEQGHVDVSISADDAHFVVKVSDSGDGIAPQFLPHLFGRFRQADATSTRRHGGLGLGLAIVQQLVEMHGGQVAAASAGPGLGATFSVTLPRQPVDTAVALPRRSAAAMAEQVVEAQSLDGLRLLAVEDQPDVLDYLGRLLEQQGAEVILAPSATTALEVLDTEGHDRIDALLTDIGMPGMDGYGLIRTIRDNMGLDAEALPAVAVTALARDDDRQRALASGFQAHLSKPYSISQLVAVIRAACARR
ncbi:PAS domain-containing sensor histidine kinase [Stenotrophomonas sp. MMGLT7]|uniref:hybrid sensor histidine kinase/response regulator n=1 Tax=Stenotrophomonas sp. MMGLT7 TaxID=2901227 RepID=UPI001E282F1E|nr:PAS domain-containing sensor histidine kinase [Stenotrophomonas sp. MMGLT7]MCD7099279.1 ATP-binding protein [Stenotrophomonas sp. MMGLT7]